MRLAAAVLALVGCGRVLGLDDIPIDQSALTVHGTYTTRRVLNSETRLPHLSDDQPAGRPPPSTFVALDDGKRMMLVWNADDTFYFDREQLAQTYRIVIPGNYPAATIEYQLAGATPQLVDREWGRGAALRATVDAGTTVQYSFATAPVSPFTGFLVLDSSGIWTQTGIATVSGSPPTNESFAFDWSGAAALPDSEALGLLDTLYNDRLYYVLYALSGTTYRLSNYRFDDVTMKDAATTTIANQPLYAVQNDTCVLVAAPRAQEIARITQAGYVAASPAIGTWRLLAIPVLTMGPTVAFPLTFDTGTADFRASPIAFGTPFAGYDLALFMQVVASHPVTAPGAAMPALLSYGSDQYILPQATSPADCAMQDSSMFPSVQLPVAPLLDGFPLQRDQPIQLDRSRLAKLTWTTTQQGAQPQLFRARLFEVAADASQATVLREHAIWYTTNMTPDGAPQVLVDPALLEMGKSYVIEIADLVGLPDAQQGDLASLSYPYAVGYAYTGLLEVTN